MEKLSKAIKQLSKKEYEQLLVEITGNRKNKPYVVLQTLRNENVDEHTLMSQLQVNRTTFYTLKSRLNYQVASLLSKKIDNPISALMEEVTKIPATLYGTNKSVAIKALIDLEKQLIEYDLNNELIIVYKNLSRLYQNQPEEFQYYNNAYEKRVAFFLSLIKAEDLFYEFFKQLGIYKMTREDTEFEKLKVILRKMSNILELYESHRLYVMFNIVKIYFNCNDPEKREGLRYMEMEIDEDLKKIKKIFDKYALDTFYQNIKHLPDFIHYEFYQKINNAVRAGHYYQQTITHVVEYARKPIMAPYITELLQSRVEQFTVDKDIIGLERLHNYLVENYEVDKTEIYHFMAWKRFQAIIKFYKGDYSGAAKLINDLRIDVSLKPYTITDAELKLFQALQYCIIGEEAMTLQLLNSIKRQVRELDDDTDEIELMVKLIKYAFKSTEFRRKMKHITELWGRIQDLTTQPDSILWYINLDDSLLRRMANPIK
jgi:hypothetical protein